MQSILRRACEAEASINTQRYVLLLCTVFSYEGDELKKECNPHGRTSNRAAPKYNDVISAEFRARTNALQFANPNAE